MTCHCKNKEATSTKHGTYALVFGCSAPFQAVAGKLGPVFLSSGYWIYVGSAFGPGGLRSAFVPSSEAIAPAPLASGLYQERPASG